MQGEGGSGHALILKLSKQARLCHRIRYGHVRHPTMHAIQEAP